MPLINKPSKLETPAALPDTDDTTMLPHETFDDLNEESLLDRILRKRRMAAMRAELAAQEPPVSDDMPSEPFASPMDLISRVRLRMTKAKVK